MRPVMVTPVVLSTILTVGALRQPAAEDDQTMSAPEIDREPSVRLVDLAHDRVLVAWPVSGSSGTAGCT